MSNDPKHGILSVIPCAQVTELLKILDGKYEKISEVVRHTSVCRHLSSSHRLLEAAPPEAPNPKCFVCNKAQVHLQIDTSAVPFKDLPAKDVKKQLGFNEPRSVHYRTAPSSYS